MKKRCPSVSEPKDELPPSVNWILHFNFLEKYLAEAPAKWKLEFKNDVIAGCHERLVRWVFDVGIAC